VPRSYVDRLAKELDVDWLHLRRARQLARSKRRELNSHLATHDAEDTTIVVFGSLAPDEFTAQSDIDWTLLVDGSADPHHQDVAHEIARHVHEVEGRSPGREGTFGSLTFSHDLIHLIGGEDDTNRNTTRRILLLLESLPIGSSDAYARILSNVLRRYLEEDRGIWYGSGRYKVPRFLLNDIVRYWRTMTVDFAYKQWSRAGRGFAIRNLKLRMSRKLIFVGGLLTCFSTQTGLSEEERAEIFGEEQHFGSRVSRLVDHLKQHKAPPLEVLAKAALERPGLHRAARELFTAYDEFIGILSEPEQRAHLESLTYEQLRGDTVFDRGRDVSHRFQAALDQIFLEPRSPFYDLTLKYGVF
jgi:predicted nucleotidyltransferase